MSSTSLYGWNILEVDTLLGLSGHDMGVSKVSFQEVLIRYFILLFGLTSISFGLPEPNGIPLAAIL